MLARVQTSVFFFSVTKIVIFRHIANNMVRLLVKTTLNNKRTTKTIKKTTKTIKKTTKTTSPFYIAV